MVFALAFRRIRLYLRDSATLCVVLFLSSVLCILSFLALYATWMPHLRLNSEKDATFRLYSVSLQEPSRDFATLQQIVDKIPMQSFAIYTGGDGPAIGAYLLDENYYAQREITYRDVDVRFVCDDEVLLPLDRSFGGASESFVIEGKKYKVKGYIPEPNTIISPSNFKEHFAFSYLSFRVASRLEQGDRDYLMSTLQTHFSIDSMMSPDVFIEFAFREIPMRMVGLALFYCLSLLSFSYLIRYIVKKQAKMNWVLRLAGMSFKKLLVLIALELFFFIATSALTGFALHLIFWESFFQRINYYGIHHFSAGDYLLVFVVVALLVLLVLLPMAVRESKATLRKLEENL